GLGPVAGRAGCAADGDSPRTRAGDVRRIAQQAGRESRGKGESRRKGRVEAGRRAAARDQARPQSGRCSRAPPQEIPTPQRQEPRPPAPTTSAPQALPDQTAAIPAAPTQGRITPHNSNAVPTWKTQIVALLERNKRYPAVAQSRREQGIAQVFFSLDRHGRVIDSRIARSWGPRPLAEEALAMLRRAQPFRAPPRELPGERVDLTVPIRFNLR